MMYQASSPVIFSATRPRMIVMLNGLSYAVIEMATRGSPSRLRALREPGPVKKATWSRSSPIHTGTLCGAPSGSTVAMWA
jgi:hypothetical protein